MSNYSLKNVGGKANGFGRNSCEYRLYVPGSEIAKHAEVLFGQGPNDVGTHLITCTKSRH